MHRFPRVRLRTIFFIFFCAAVGLSVGTISSGEAGDPNWFAGLRVARLDWLYALLATASVALAIGLVQQAVQVARISRVHATSADLAFARSFAIFWRLAIAGLVVACLASTVLIRRRMVVLPERETYYWYDLVPYVLWVCCILIVLMSSVHQLQFGRSNGSTCGWRHVVGWCLATLLVLLFLPHIGMLYYLVHLAIEGVELAQSLAVRRAGTFPDHRAEGFSLFWISLAACVCVAFAAALLVSTQCKGAPSRSSHILTIMGAIGSLFVAALYCVWFYRVELHRISPDFAVAGVGSNWLEQAAGIIIAAMFITAAAYRMTAGYHSRAKLEARDGLAEAQAPHESAVYALLLVCAAAIFVIEMVRMHVSIPSFLVLGTSGWRIVDAIASLFADPPSLLILAMGALSLHLCWLRWRRQDEQASLTLSDVPARQFLWNWFAIALVAVVGLPTLSSFCFVFWLGPWYLYGL